MILRVSGSEAKVKPLAKGKVEHIKGYFFRGELPSTASSAQMEKSILLMIQNMEPPAKRWQCWLYRIRQKNSYKVGRHQIFLLKHCSHLYLPALTFSCSSLTLSSTFTCHPLNLIPPPFKIYFIKLIFKAPCCHICCVSLSAALSFHFSFCIFFKATEKKLTFTVQCLLSQMREEKLRSTSSFPSKYLGNVLVLKGVWTDRHEICLNLFFLDWS